MDYSEACIVLGVSETATEDEIERRYRKLARENHTDLGGSKERMQDINLARDVIKSHHASRGDMVPVDIARELVVATTNALVERNEVARDVERVERRISKRLTGGLRRSKSMSKVFGAMSAAAFFMSKNLTDQFLGASVSAELLRMVQLGALSVGIYAGVMHWYLSQRIERAENELAEFSDFLSVRSNYVSIVVEITRKSNRWKLADLESGLLKWAKHDDGRHIRWSQLVRQIGSEEYARLLVTKGTQNGLLVRDESIDGLEFVEWYSLDLSPRTQVKSA